MIEKILEKMSDFNRPQALGVAALIFIAHREQTSLHHQWEELGFSDIPETFVDSIDQLDGDYQFAIASFVAKKFTEESTAQKVSFHQQQTGIRRA